MRMLTSLSGTLSYKQSVYPCCPMNCLCLLLLSAALLTLPLVSFADDDERRRHSQREFSEEFRDRGCKVKRKMESDGDFKEEVECSRHRAYRGVQYEREFFDGACKVKQKMEEGGKYKEERECKGGPHEQPVPHPVYVPAPPLAEPGVVINGTVRIK